MPCPGSVYIHTWVPVLQGEIMPGLGLLQVNTLKRWELTLLLTWCSWGERIKQVFLGNTVRCILEKKIPSSSKPKTLYLQSQLLVSAFLRGLWNSHLAGGAWAAGNRPRLLREDLGMLFHVEIWVYRMLAIFFLSRLICQDGHSMARFWQAAFWSYLCFMKSTRGFWMVWDGGWQPSLHDAVF